MNFLIPHLRAGFSIVALACNLLVWVTPLIALALIRFVRRSGGGPLETRLIQGCYRNAVGINSWWLRRISGVQMVAHELAEDGQRSTEYFNLTGENVVVLANHRTWFDIPLLQALTVPSGPILKFVVKRELAWVPIIGWICLVLQFPMMRRGGTARARSADLQAISRAAQDKSSAQDALIIFAEGTRITEAKRIQTESPYTHLLAPKAAGFRTVVRHSPTNATVCDMTIIYRAEEVSFWRCLGGRIPRVDVYLRRRPLAEADDVRVFLADTWVAKDALIAKCMRAGQTTAAS